MKRFFLILCAMLYVGLGHTLTILGRLIRWLYLIVAKAVEGIVYYSKQFLKWLEEHKDDRKVFTSFQILFFLASVTVGYQLNYLINRDSKDSKVATVATAPKPITGQKSVSKEDKPKRAEKAPARSQISPDFASMRFFEKPLCIREIADIRKDNYGKASSKKLIITEHAGGEMLDPLDMWMTIGAVIQRMPNLKTTDDLKKLAFETIVTETWFGHADFDFTARKYKNYGIAQFRMDTAKDTLSWLKSKRPDVHEAVMSLYNNKLSLKDNLHSNVPFGIAMMLQYYWRVAPDLYSNIGTRTGRAKLWKSVYNTPKGVGSVNAFIKRNNKFDKEILKGSDLTLTELSKEMMAALNEPFKCEYISQDS